MSDNQTIRRSKHNKDYLVIGNKLAQNRKLSYEARGLLIELLSRPDDWQTNINALTITGKAGRDKVRRIINELIEHKYISERERIQKEDGTFYYTPYVVYEQPLTEKPLTVKPSTENPTLQSTEVKSTDINAGAFTDTFDFNEYKQAIAETFGVNGNRVMNLLHLMRGTSKKKGYKEYAVTPAATIAELRGGNGYKGFKNWYYENNNANIPLSPEKIQSHFLNYRAYEDKRKTADAARQQKEQVEPVIEATPEQRQALAEQMRLTRQQLKERMA